MTNTSFTLVRVVLSLLFASMLLVPLWWYGGLELADLQNAWNRLTLGALLPALGLYAGMNLLRTLRFRLLIPPAERPRFAPLLGVTSAYSMAATVLPAKIGEATFVLYANRACGVPAASGLAALVVSRLLDLATLAGMFALACLALHISHAYPGIPWFLAVGSCLFAISAVCFFLSSRGDLLVIFALTIVRWLGLERVRAGRTIVTRSEQVAGALRFAGGEGRLVPAALVSVPIWLMIFLFCAVLGRGFGLPAELSLAELSFGSALAIVTSLIPISAFANFGTLEAGWVIGFEMLGVPRDLAAATGLGLHVVQVGLCIAFGIAGHVIMGFAKRERPAPVARRPG